jgi:small subunit ribosomal protein S5e
MKLRIWQRKLWRQIQGSEIRGLWLIFASHSDYIQIRAPVYISHSAGRYAQKRFRKAQCPIIERLTNSLMMNGRNNGKKLMAVRIVAHAFEIVRPG